MIDKKIAHFFFFYLESNKKEKREKLFRKVFNEDDSKQNFLNFLFIFVNVFCLAIEKLPI